jgi:hypothetical protein
MMDNVMGCLLSAISSFQQIMVANGGMSFSLSTQTEATIELLESILVPKSEKYVDTALRHFFMMNNWRYLEVAIQRRELNEIFENVWCQKFRVKVQQKLELYQRNSWDNVLKFLKFDIKDSSMELSFCSRFYERKSQLF